ncbi:Negative elongation factor C/D [Geranomyces variabilis]|nr:Negative elongation factor C/D [Geranomyces variabilis]
MDSDDSATAQYCQRFAQLMEEVPNLRESDIDEWVMNTLAPECNDDAQFYVTVQSLLGKLSFDRSPDGRTWGRVFARISELLEKHSSHATNTALAEELRASLLSSADPQISEVVIEVHRNGQVPEESVEKLYNLYHSESPPSVAYLRDPVLLDALIAATFDPSRSEILLNERLWILAYASTVTENDSVKQRTDEVQECLDALKSLDSLVSKITAMSQMPDHMSAFMQATSLPITSMALLHWVEASMELPAFYQWGFVSEEVPTPLEILDEIAITQRSVRDPLANFWLRMLRRPSTDIPPRYFLHIKQFVCDRLILMCKIGHSIPILHALLGDAKAVGEELKVYFLTNLLRAIEPPYPPRFATLVRLIASSFSAPLTIDGQIHELGMPDES